MKFLEAAFEHHEKEACLLFQTANDRSAITACQRAFNEYGKEKTMEGISKYIPLDNPQMKPILHHVAKHAYMKDSDGRNLDQAMLASRKTAFESNAMYFMAKHVEQQPSAGNQPPHRLVLFHDDMK